MCAIDTVHCVIANDNINIKNPLLFIDITNLIVIIDDINDNTPTIHDTIFILLLYIISLIFLYHHSIINSR